MGNSIQNMINTPGKNNKSLNKLQNLQRNKRKGKQPWFNLDCRKLKRKLNYICKAVNRNPNNTYLRNIYYKIRKEYRNLIKNSKRKYEEERIKKLEISSGNRKEFWKILKYMR